MAETARQPKLTGTQTDAQALGAIRGDADLKAALAKRGIETPAEYVAPQPDLLETFDALDMCSEPTTTPKAIKQSVIFVKLGEPELMDSTKEGSKKFMVCEVFHEKWGPMLLTHTAIRKDDSITPLYHWVHTRVKVGEMFRFATFPTSAGYKVIRPIPVG